MKSSRQNDKLEHWVMHRDVKDEVLGSILGSNKQKVFFHLQLSLLHRLSIKVCSIINLFTNKSRNPFNKRLERRRNRQSDKFYETVKNSMFRRTDVFIKRIIT